MSWEVLIAAFTAGVAWAHVVHKVNCLDRKMTEVKQNDLRHLQEAVDALPCLTDFDCPEDAE